MTAVITHTSSFERLVRDIASEYKRRGYTVAIGPEGNSLPDFLTGFRPDIIATAPDESVVVGVRDAGATRETANWGELAKAIKQHPGWRLELIVRPAGSDGTPPISPEEIDRRLNEGIELASHDKLDSSMLIIWSALEAAIVRALTQDEIPIRDYRPAALISVAYSEGYLDREDYDLLMECLQTRNQVAHGIQSSPVDRSCIVEIQRIAREQMNPEPEPDVSILEHAK